MTMRLAFILHNFILISNREANNLFYFRVVPFEDYDDDPLGWSANGGFSSSWLLSGGLCDFFFNSTWCEQWSHSSSDSEELSPKTFGLTYTQQHFDFFLSMCSLSTVVSVHWTFFSAFGLCNRSLSVGATCNGECKNLFRKKFIYFAFKIIE